MNGPFDRLSNALQNKRSQSSKYEINKMVKVYEAISLLLVIPSLIIFVPGFIFSLFNYYLSRLITKGLTSASFVLIGIVNTGYIVVTFYYYKPEFYIAETSPWFVICLPIIFLLSGYSALFYQLKEIKNAS